MPRKPQPPALGQHMYKCAVRGLALTSQRFPSPALLGPQKGTAMLRLEGRLC